MDDTVAGTDVVVEFLERAAAGDDEVFLYRHLECGPLEVLGQQCAIGQELPADRGEKSFLLPGTIPRYCHPERESRDLAWRGGTHASCVVPPNRPGPSTHVGMTAGMNHPD